ncbi:MAG: signal peptidase I [Hyphomonadaceae bacterium]|nr:signal peptidase I [Hyphomonadaceae bacterium]MBC6412972.1 signal peptidase I [Hyphomonadaceae bacterium]
MSTKSNTSDTPRKDGKPKRSLKEAAVSEVKFFTKLFAFLFVFYTTVFGHFKIPSESMQPALEVGDHLYVSKFAYGYSRHSLPLGFHRLPFLGEGKILTRSPKRGDVVVFRNPKSGIIMIKRVLGLPGDEIVVRHGRYTVNGQRIERELVDSFTYRDFRYKNPTAVNVYSEQWPGQKDPHQIFEISDSRQLDNAGRFIVPEGHYMMLGDNRDNSVDSRAVDGPGLVAHRYLIGRADMVMFSFNRCKREEGFRCPGRRFLKSL